MKAIVISIKPNWVADILNGRKTIEVRKVAPKCDLPIDVYIYCTKDKDTLLTYQPQYPRFICPNQSVYVDRKKAVANSFNGKVVAKFTLRKVEEIPSRKFSVYYFPYTETLDDYDLLTKSCLTTEEMDDYLGYDKKGYAYHIEDLVVFDKPKELSEFKHICPNIMCDKCNYADLSVDKCLPICSNQLKQAPQNFCYVESEE